MLYYCISLAAAISFPLKSHGYQDWHVYFPLSTWLPNSSGFSVRLFSYQAFCQQLFDFRQLLLDRFGVTAPSTLDRISNVYSAAGRRIRIGPTNLVVDDHILNNDQQLYVYYINNNNNKSLGFLLSTPLGRGYLRLYSFSVTIFWFSCFCRNVPNLDCWNGDVLLPTMWAATSRFAMC